MAKTFNSITAYNLEGIILNKNEIYCLRLSLHGYNTSKICDFLEVNIDTLYNIKKEIMYKLKCSSWYESILKAFQYNFLKHEDYISETVKEKILNLSNQILKNISADLNKESINYIISEILELLKSCNKKIFNKSFIINEDTWLKGITNYYINEQLNLTPSKTFHKIFNTFKNGFQFKKHNEDIFLKNTEIQTIESASKIAFYISNKNNASDKEKELMVYHEIIRYYTKIEYNYLCKKYFTNHISNSL